MYIIISIIISLSLILDFTIGTIPVEIFSFPLNIIILLSIIFYIGILPNKPNSKPIYTQLLRIGTAKGAITICTLLSIVIILSILFPTTFFPKSWLFSAVIVMLLISLGILIKKQIVNIFNGIKTTHNLRQLTNNSSFLIHLGIFITISSLLFGTPDTTTLYQQSKQHIPSDFCYTPEGNAYKLPFKILSTDIDIITKNNSITDFTASFYTIEKDTIKIHHTTRPNHPAHYKGFDIYLKDIKTSDCENTQQVTYILQKNPWKTVTYSGITICILGLLTLFLKR